MDLGMWPWHQVPSSSHVWYRLDPGIERQAGTEPGETLGLLRLAKRRPRCHGGQLAGSAPSPSPFCRSQRRTAWQIRGSRLFEAVFFFSVSVNRSKNRPSPSTGTPTGDGGCSTPSPVLPCRPRPCLHFGFFLSDLALTTVRAGQIAPTTCFGIRVELLETGLHMCLSL